MGKHSDEKACSFCSGTGKVTVNIDNKTEEKTCPICKGTRKQ